jgi:FKBP-type peptidyl-prolyl cis-trans isomerase 2
MTPAVGSRVLVVTSRGPRLATVRQVDGTDAVVDLDDRGHGPAGDHLGVCVKLDELLPADEADELPPPATTATWRRRPSRRR